MNKNKVDSLIPAAYQALIDTGIAKDNTINSAYRGQISRFGAAVSMGSLLSAIAFFKDKGNASVDRTKLINAMARVLGKKDLYAYVLEQVKEDTTKSAEMTCREEILEAAIALKLAMNLFVLEDGKENVSENA